MKVKFKDIPLNIQSLLILLQRVKRRFLYLKSRQEPTPFDFEIEDLLEKKFKVKKRGNNILIYKSDQCLGQKYLLRIGTSDKAVFNQVIDNREYYPIIKLIKEKFSNISIKLIVDAGSNIGLTSIYFHSIFPSARIISIEPDESNYKQQLMNLKINNLSDKILVLNKALWINDYDNLTVCSDFRDGRNWAKSVKLSIGEDLLSVKSITLSEIINKYLAGQIIDILKIDIEGTENELFKSAEFIKTLSIFVRFICLEIHDEFRIREQISKIFSENHFEIFDVDETTFCYNKILNN